MIGLTFSGVSKRFQAPIGEIVALAGLDLAIPAGQFAVIVGANGSGKSTLLNVAAGDDRPDSGTIKAVLAAEETEWSGLPANQRSQRVARVHQDPARGAAEELTVAEHLRLVRLGARPAVFAPALSRRDRADLADRLRGSAIEAKFDAAVAELSGGQRQLLALEMAVARRADLWLLDEPTAALDRHNAAFCLERTGALQRALGITVLLVTHDLNAASRLGDRLIVLQDGKLKADIDGAAKARLSPEDIFRLCDPNFPVR